MNGSPMPWEKTIAEFVKNEQSFKMFAAFGSDYAKVAIWEDGCGAGCAMSPKNATARKLS